MAEKDDTWNLNVNLHDFPKDTLTEIKNLSDKHNGSREWLANIYYSDGKYVIGSPVFGNYSGVSMRPDEQAVKDHISTGVKECVEIGHEKNACKVIMKNQVKEKGRQIFSARSYPGSKPRFGATPEELVSTIHLHPIRPLSSTRDTDARQQFSGTDIGSEFAKSIRDGKHYKMFLTYPKTEGGRRHNMLKMLTFNGKSSMDVMKKSNPHMSAEQILDITPEGKNIDIVDWYAYQVEAKKRGLLQEIDIENATGAEAYRAYGNTYMGLAIAGVAVTLLLVYLYNRSKNKSK